MSNPRNYQGTGDLIYSAVGHKTKYIYYSQILKQQANTEVYTGYIQQKT